MTGAEAFLGTELLALVKTIATKSEILKNKIIGLYKTDLRWVCIFTQSQAQYEKIESILAKAGRAVDDTPSGNVYKIPSVETDAGSFEILKNRKPDPTRPEFGDCDFALNDYESFKRENLGRDGFKLIKRTNSEMIEYMETGGDVRIYFTNPPVSY